MAAAGARQGKRRPARVTLAGESRIVGIQREEFHRDEGGHPKYLPVVVQPFLPERRLLVQEVLELRLGWPSSGFSSM